MRIVRALFVVGVLTLMTHCENSDLPITEVARNFLSQEDQVIINQANQYLSQKPSPITHFTSSRSAGGIHDFYSEGDYWWQNPENPSGPYIRRDGLSNPDNFLEHRQAMRNLNQWVSTLVAAFQLSGEVRYALHAISHLEAFFLHPDTRMNPSLLYAQAIQGRHKGRGIGIIDTIHLIEVARSILRLDSQGAIPKDVFTDLQQWFDDYATWMNTHQFGLDEKNHGNNHSTWWAAQIAAFSELAGNEELMQVARSQFKVLLSQQMAVDGSFPEELDRTKPYNYSLFNLEGYAILCHIATSDKENLWEYEGKNGSIRKAFEYMTPFVNDKSSWPKPPDVSHFNEIPIQSVGLLIGAIAYNNIDYYNVWKSLSPEKKSEEVMRNFPLWHAHNWI